MTNFSDMLSKAKEMQEKMKEAQNQIKKIGYNDNFDIESRNKRQFLEDQNL